MKVGISADGGVHEAYKSANEALIEALKKSDKVVEELYGTDVPSIGLAKSIGFRVRSEKMAEGDFKIELVPSKSGVTLRVIRKKTRKRDKKSATRIRKRFLFKEHER